MQLAALDVDVTAHDLTPEAARQSIVWGENREVAWRPAQEAAGGAGVYSQDDRELWAAVEESERMDVLPEFWSGHNIADFVDAEVDERLAALEAEEDAAAASWQAQVRILCCTLSSKGSCEAAELKLPTRLCHQARLAALQVLGRPG